MQKPLVVTTDRGVFFGYGVPKLGIRDIRLERCRMVVYWSPDVRSVAGLAANGPSNACRISPAAPAVIIKDVTAIMECSREAAKQFEHGPWAD